MIRSAIAIVLAIAAAAPVQGQVIYSENQKPASGVTIEYTVAVSNPLSHLYDIEIAIGGIRTDSVEVAMPAWAPGVYFILDYARNVQRFAAVSDHDRVLTWAQLDKQTWRISKLPDEDVRVHYQIYSPELTDEMAEISTGPATFMYVVGQKHVPVSVKYDVPSKWDVYTGLEKRGSRYHAGDYDILVDAPVFIGEFKVLGFETESGIPHRIVFSNPRIGVIDQQVIADIQDLVNAAIAMFGPLPYKDYTFLLKVQAAAGASLEHLNSARITVGENDFVNQTGYRRFLTAAAHSIVQVWNGTRLRPRVLGSTAGPFDYSKEIYTKLLWFMEGASTYQADLLQVRAGILTPPEFISQASAAIDALQHQPGRQLMSLEEGSWNTWVRSDNGANNSISYIAKGAIVGMLLDLEIRARTKSAKTLSDVVQYLMTNYGDKGIGVPEDGVLRAVEEIAGAGLRDFFEVAVSGKQELPYDRYLQSAGLHMDVSKQPSMIYIGIETERADGNQARIRRVAPNSPAERAKIDAGDILIALDSERVTFDNLSSRVRSKRIRQNVAVTVLRGERLLMLTVVPMEFQEERWSLVEDLNGPPEQIQLRDVWIGR